MILEDRVDFIEKSILNVRMHGQIVRYEFERSGSRLVSGDQEEERLRHDLVIGERFLQRPTEFVAAIVESCVNRSFMFDLLISLFRCVILFFFMLDYTLNKVISSLNNFRFKK